MSTDSRLDTSKVARTNGTTPPTASKPGYGPALGVEGFAALAPLGPPAYALGGVGPDHVPDLLAAGATGVAVMGPVMRDPSVVRDYLAALA